MHVSTKFNYWSQYNSAEFSNPTQLPVSISRHQTAQHRERERDLKKRKLIADEHVLINKDFIGVR